MLNLRQSYSSVNCVRLLKESHNLQIESLVSLFSFLAKYVERWGIGARSLCFSDKQCFCCLNIQYCISYANDNKNNMFSIFLHCLTCMGRELKPWSTASTAAFGTRSPTIRWLSAVVSMRTTRSRLWLCRACGKCHLTLYLLIFRLIIGSESKVIEISTSFSSSILKVQSNHSDAKCTK